MITDIKPGMWAIRDCVMWKEEMFEVTESFIKSISEVGEISEDTYFAVVPTCRWKDSFYIISYTKSDLKSYIIGNLFKVIENLDSQVLKIQEDKMKFQGIINKIAGD